MITRPSRKPLISLCMIVRNEEEGLAQCLNSVHGVADELIVVDTGSTDSTVEIARSLGARIISFPWSGDFAAARNAGLKQARGTWILVMDGDEELDAGSKEELLLCAEHTEYEAFFLRIHNHQGTSAASQTLTINPILRMFRNRPQYRFSGIIHEQIAAAIVQATPEAAIHLTSVIVHHYGYADGVVVLKNKIKRNVALLEEQLKQNPGDAYHHFNMAVEYMRLGEYEPALRHIKGSLDKIEPCTNYIHLLYKYEARCQAAIGDLPGALDACDRGIILYPDYPDLHHIKGGLLLQASAFPPARAALQKALDIGSSPPEYHTDSGAGTYQTLLMLGQLCQETGEDAEAVACYTQAAQLHPEPGPLYARLLRSLKCANREPEIAEWFTAHFPERFPLDSNDLLRLLLHEGCYTAAADLLDSRSRPSEEETAMEHAAPGTTEQFLEQIRAIKDTPPAQLTHSSIALLLEHPLVSGQKQHIDVSSTSTDSPGCIWILLADHALAALSSTDVCYPAARRARLSFPLVH